jgi:mono/diheme cytochrome c family protein
VTNFKVFLVVVGTLGLYTWVANAIPQLESEVPEELSFTGEVSEAQLVAAGEELYNGGAGCTACHGGGTRAPNLLTDHSGEGTIGQRCGDRVPGEDCKTYLYASLVDPVAHVVAGFDPMVFQARSYSGAQLWSMVAFLEAQGGTVTVTAEDVRAAESAAPATVGGGGPTPPATEATDPVEIMRANLCLACHQLDGEGVALGPSFDGIGARADADFIRRSILDPGDGASAGFEQFLGVMPATYGQSLTAAQLEALVSYLAERR